MSIPVLIVDFGSQVTQLIARRVRETGVYCEIVPFNKAEEALARAQPRAIILSGGPASVTESDTPRAPQRVFEMGVPVLGICYGQRRWWSNWAARSKRRTMPANSAAPGWRSRATSPLFEGVWQLGERRRCVDEPWRPRDRAAAGIRRGGHQRQCAVRDGGGRETQILRLDVPSRSDAHAPRRRTAAEFRRKNCGHRSPNGTWRRSAPKRSRGSANRWARAASSAGCPAAWIRRWPRSSSMKRSATSSLASMSTRG